MHRPDHHRHHVPGPQPLGRVAILGLGLIGGSLGQVLSAVGAAEDVCGWDVDPETNAEVEKSSSITRVTSRLKDAVSHADLVVLCVPVNQVVPVFHGVREHLKPNAVVTDVAGTKSRIVAEGEKTFGGRFLGGHPMAGSEESGFAASSVDLFDAATWLITPTPNTDSGAVEMVCRMADWCGATARCCTPDDHDRVIGYLSHLPHLLAFGLSSSVAEKIDNEFADAAAGSFKSATRVALSDPAQWTEILHDNRANAVSALLEFETWAARAADALESRDKAGLQSLLTAAHNARKRFQR